MGQEVVGVYVEGVVVIAHRSSEVVDVDACQGAVDVTVHVVGLEVQRLGKRLVGSLPFLARQCHIGTRSPGLAIVRVEHQTLVEPFLGVERVLFLQIDLGFERIGLRELVPSGDDGIELSEGVVILAVLHLAKGSVEPIVAVAGL